jgi:mannosyltransferase
MNLISRLRKIYDKLDSGMILILLTAFACYLYRLHEPSYWLDEAVSLEMSRDWAGLWERLLSREANMWLYYVQLHFWQQGSQLEFYTRFLSVGFSLLSVALLYSLSLRLFKNRDIAFISSLVMAVNPFMLRYAQESRGYSETLFFVTLASYLLVRGQESQRKIWWVAYGLCITIGLYLHLFVMWIAIAHAVWLLSLEKKSWGNWLLGASVAGMGVLSVLIVQPVLSSSQVNWIPLFEMEQLRDLVIYLTGYSRSLQIFYLLAFVLALLYFFKKRGEEVQGLAWIWLLVPIVATIVVSLIKPLFIARYFIIILSPAAILIALGISRLSKRWMIAIFVALIFFVSLRSIHSTVEDRIERPHSSIREVMAYLSEVTEAEDLLIVQEKHTWPDVIRYYAWRFDVVMSVGNEDSLLSSEESHSEIWLLYMTVLPPENTEALLGNYRFIESIPFDGLTLWHYELIE